MDTATISKLVNKYGSPLYIYDEEIINRQIDILATALPGFEIFYSIKANPHPDVLKHMQKNGLGVDAASPKEVDTAIASGFSKNNIIYSSPGKTRGDIELNLNQSILIADSFHELMLIEDICAERGYKVEVGLRINPEFSISLSNSSEFLPGVAVKFGIDAADLLVHKPFFDKLQHVKISAIHVYTRSQVLGADTICKYIEQVLSLAEFCIKDMQWPIKTIDFGGGFGIPYPDSQETTEWQTLRSKVQQLLAVHPLLQAHKMRLIVESGRFLMAEAGIFATQIVDIKYSRDQKFLLVHGGLTGFIRPSMQCLVAALTTTEPTSSFEPLFTSLNAFTPHIITKKEAQETECVNVIGSLCTSMDIMARGVTLAKAEIGDIIYFNYAGAYAATLSPRDFGGHEHPQEIFVTSKS